MITVKWMTGMKLDSGTRNSRSPYSCKHKTVQVRYDDDDFWFYPGSIRSGNVVAKRCARCRVTLSLGPSSDEPEAVGVEMRAAETIAVGAYIAESNAWRNDDADTITVTSDDSFFEQYNATLWPWDPSRPVAGQYEEWVCAAEAEADTPSRHLDGWTGDDREVTARPSIASLIADDDDDVEPVDPATKFGELAKQVAVPVDMIDYADAQAEHDDFSGRFSVVELLIGPEPETGVQFDVEVGPCDEDVIAEAAYAPPVSPSDDCEQHETFEETLP